MDVTPRLPAVAGRFYPAAPDALAESLKRLRPAQVTPQAGVRALIAPHAGYQYSGAIAAETYARSCIPERVVVLCPNHTGMGRRRSVWPQGVWRMPGRDVPVDAALAAELVQHAGLEPDVQAHLREHAIEVHLPFLIDRQPALQIVPVCLSQLTYEECESVARGVAAVIASRAEPVLVVASTDMSHYVSAAHAKREDELLIQQMLALDAAGLYGAVVERNSSMCGFIPSTVALSVARRLGSKRAELVRYGNSGEVSGDYERVVGYAGLQLY